MSGVCFADSLLAPLSESQARETRKLFASFKANPKGPFVRIRWFCKDGTVHPPSPPPCKSRGGGHQYAELSADARRLQPWNIDVGVILVSLKPDQFFDKDRDHYLMRELVLQHYLAEVDQGWIYRKANSYRGARQIEDEEKAGRALLAGILTNPEWTDRNYYLVTELIQAVPHGIEDSAVKKIRALAAAIADKDVRFQGIRAKIHSAPGPDDLELVRKFGAEQKPAPDAKALIDELAGLLVTRNNNAGLNQQLALVRQQYRDGNVGAALAAFESGPQSSRFSAAARLSEAIRREVAAARDGRRNLDLLDFNSLLLDYAFNMAKPLHGAKRREHLDQFQDFFRLAFGAGLLSARQFEELGKTIDSLRTAGSLPAQAYAVEIKQLARSLEWSRATVARHFGGVAQHYEAAEPLARALPDHLLRGSIALPMASVAETLVADANRATGIRHSIFGESSSRGIVGLNPGIASGTFRIIHSEEEAQKADPRGIYLIPETASDLKPMAGILTLDSGNALSHAQLLAANLGIPNATVPSTLLPVLEKHIGQELFFAVTPRGVVVLKPKTDLSAAEKALFAQPARVRARMDLDTSRVNLSVNKVLTLSGITAKDSGILCGPKAANLGQLATYFPDKVAPGLVIPFGVYYHHISRKLPGQARSLAERIKEAFVEADRMRDAGAEPAALNAYIYPRLAEFRKEIQNIALEPSFERDLGAQLDKLFGPDGSYGVFIRSDTNAEDLPEFTGAGLNLTVPNQVGRANILKAIRDVWASPFTERAYDWRSRVLRGNDRVYPSVVVLKTVPSDKSGVIATINLESGDRSETTVNVAEGTSAVVDGGVAESLLLKPDGSVRLLQQGRATYRKVAVPTGGFRNAAPVGEDYLLKPDEIRQLRAAVDEINRKYPVERNERGETMPWDIEFGFEKGQLRLFQIRPLVRFQELSTLGALSKLETSGSGVRSVSLEERI
jgi:hypothetical protein